VPTARPRVHAWYVAVALGAAAPLAAVLATGRTLAWRDTARLFAPMRPLVEDALRGGRLPLWNPHEALGVPLLAQLMHGVLHPVSIAAALLGPGTGMDPIIVAHVVLAALGGAFLARRLGASPAAAAVAGLGYGLSGYVLGMTAVVQYLGAAGTAPWTVAALHAAGRGGRAAIALAAAAVAALLLAGDPQWAAIAAGLGIALAAEAGRGRGAVRAAIATALGGAIAAVQLAPTWAYFRETVRSAGLTSEDRLQWALAPWRILELVAPGFFAGRPGPPSAPVFQRLGGPTQYPIPFVPSVFVGAIVVALAIRGARSSGSARVLAVAAAALLWLALGAHLGADQALGWVPVWGAFRYAEKIVGPLTLCLAVLAALGTDRAEGPRPIPLAAAAAAAALATAALWVRSTGDTGALVAGRLAIGLAHAAGGLALLAAAAVVSARSTRAAAAFPAIAAALVFVQSVAAAPFALHAGDRSAREERPLQALRSETAVPRVATATDQVMLLGPARLDEWDRLVGVTSRMADPAFGVSGAVDSLTTYTGLVPRRFQATDDALRRAFGEERWIAWRRFGLTHVVVNAAANVDPASGRIASIATASGQAVLEDRDWGFSVWAVPGRPWASFAPAAVRPGAGATGRLVEEIAAGGAAAVVDAPLPPALAPGRVLAASRGAERLRIEAEAGGDALLVVNDAWWPGWRATLDGSPVPVLEADGLVRALAWPAGRHVLEMRYDPPEVRAGLAVSACGLLAAAALAASGRRVRRRSPPAAERR
jgi:hypothetical protein